MDEWKQIEGGTAVTPFGFRAAAVAAGIKKNDDLDLTIIYSDRDCQAAAVFTLNQVAAAPIIVSREVMASNATRIRGVVINAGNANACTGQRGLSAARTMQTETATGLGCQPNQIGVMSTGVIGVHLPVAKVTAGIRAAIPQLSRHGGDAAAQAIMTTDIVPKALAVSVELSGGTVTIGGMAKGSGMIHPNMATMLGVVTTDAEIPAGPLQDLLTAATNKSFNRISVDGDTSTNDNVMLLANGAAEVVVEAADIPKFQRALDYVCIQLAQAIVRDGEGATKFVELRVTSLRSEADALQIANTVATSPLVKTALAGSDANWGRIVAAAGRAGVPLDTSKIALWVSKDKENWVHVLSGGMPTTYREEDAAEVFGASDIYLHLDFALGQAATTIWTCDLGHGYVSINGDYRS